MLYFVSVGASCYTPTSDGTIQLAKGKRGMGSDALITRLMRVTIETGTMTASVASLDLILFLTFKHNNLHMAP